MKIDFDTKELKISIRELASFTEFPSESMGRYTGLSIKLRSSIGRNIHSHYQQKITERIPKVKTEEYIRYEQQVNDWIVKLNGRIDVVYRENQFTVVEEIKSTVDPLELDDIIKPEYIQQLILYAHGYHLDGQKVKCNLVVIDIFTDNQTIIPIEFIDQSSFIHQQVRNIIEFYDEIRELKIKAKQRHSTIVFPFDKFRPSQEKLMDLVTSSLQSNQNLMISAPSGMGKTIGTLYPALKFTIQNNLRLFIATSKTTQQRIYEDTLKQMSQKKSNFNSIILTAKEKICNNTEFNCDPSICNYLDNYMKHGDKPSIKRLLKKSVLNSRIIKREANNVKICAFELSLDVALDCDVIVGDYNYIFHPQIQLRRFFEDPYKDSIVIIDEAHNLVQRSLNYYSPIITYNDIMKTINHLKISVLSSKLVNMGLDILGQISRFILAFRDEIPIDSRWEDHIIRINYDRFIEWQKTIDLFVIRYVKEYTIRYGLVPSPKDPVQEFADKFSYFTSILKDSDNPEFSQLYNSNLNYIKIFCKSAADRLSKQLRGFYSVIAQSATLIPTDYFQKMLGFTDDIRIEQFQSIFPKENQLRMIYPKISTKYHLRKQYEDEIVELIVQTMKFKKGNYLAFFSSFSYLKSIYYKLSKMNIQQKILIQEPNMSEKNRKSIMKKMEENNNSYLLLGVHGGIFSEGVDFIGNMAIGVFIIGPGLPAYTFEQELQKTYFQEKWQQGFQFAYRNPGMIKVMQAAGRVFRTENDKGFVLLIGQRFDTTYYQEVLPNDWNIFSHSQPTKLINKFWNEI